MKQGWTEATLGELLAEARPGFASGADLDEGLFQIRMNNLTRDGSFDFSKKRRVPPDSKNVGRFLLEPGDVLFNATNSPEMVGKSAYFSGYSEPAVFSNHFLRLRPAERLDGRYLAHWLRAQFQRGVFAAGCRKWVNQATFGKDSLVALQLPLPSLEEQQRIAAILDKADELQTKRRAAIAHLDSLLQAAFADRFGAEMSSGVAVELNEVIHPDRPICYGILKPGPDLPGGRPYVRVVDMVDGGIAHDHVRRTSASIDHQYRRSRLSTGDLVISIRGHVGRLALVPPELDGANITQDSARLSVNGADPAFVVEHLRHPLTQEWLRRNTKGAAVRGINIGDLRRVPVFLPAAEAQTEYAELWRKVDRVKASASAAMRCSAELVASLQARAFRGEV